MDSLDALSTRVITADFNTIKYDSEKLEGQIRTTIDKLDFNDFI